MRIPKSPPGDPRVRMMLRVASKIIAFQEACQAVVRFTKCPETFWAVQVLSMIVGLVGHIGPIVEEDESRGETGPSHKYIQVG